VGFLNRVLADPARLTGAAPAIRRYLTVKVFFIRIGCAAQK
jgi:hypothetical protein